MSRLLRLGGLCVLALTLAGCQLLLPGFYGGAPDPFEPDLGAESAYEAGRATLEIDANGTTQTVTLDELIEGTSFDGFSTVTWRNDEGWALTLNTYDMGVPFSDAGGDITIQHVFDNQLWTTDSFSTMNSCDIDASESDDGLSGTADCSGLRWVDGLGGPSIATGPRYVEDEPEFDLTITFEAVPANGAHG